MNEPTTEKGRRPERDTSIGITFFYPEQQTEHLLELINEFADDAQTLAMLTAVLEAKLSPDNDQAQALSISLCLAEVMYNTFIPIDLYNAIGDAVADIQSEIHADFVLRSGGLVPGIISVATKEKRSNL